MTNRTNATEWQDQYNGTSGQDEYDEEYDDDYELETTGGSACYSCA